MRDRKRQGVNVGVRAWVAPERVFCGGFLEGQDRREVPFVPSLVVTMTSSENPNHPKQLHVRCGHPSKSS